MSGKAKAVIAQRAKTRTFSLQLRGFLARANATAVVAWESEPNEVTDVIGQFYVKAPANRIPNFNSDLKAEGEKTWFYPKMLDNWQELLFTVVGHVCPYLFTNWNIHVRVAATTVRVMAKLGNQAEVSTLFWAYLSDKAVIPNSSTPLRMLLAPIMDQNTTTDEEDSDDDLF